MHTFKDNEGTEWAVKVNGISLGRVEESMGVSFSNPKDDQGPLVHIACDAMFAFKVAYILCKAQADERGMTDEQFSERLVGDALGRAQKAVLDAVVEFLPRAEQRQAAQQVIDTLREAELVAIEHSSKKLAEIDIGEAVKGVIDAQLA